MREITKGTGSREGKGDESEEEGETGWESGERKRQKSKRSK